MLEQLRHIKKPEDIKSVISEIDDLLDDYEIDPNLDEAGMFIRKTDIEASRLYNLVTLFGTVFQQHPNPEIRKVAYEQAYAFLRQQNTFYSDKEKYEKILNLDDSLLSESQNRWRKKYLSMAISCGVGIENKDKTREKLNVHHGEFQENLRTATEETVLVRDRETLLNMGLPESFVNSLPQNKLDPNKLNVTSRNSHYPIAMRASDPDFRKELAFLRAGLAPQNREIFRKSLVLANELAKKFGRNNWADLETVNLSLVDSYQEVSELLDKIVDNLQIKARRMLTKDGSMGQLKLWDVSYKIDQLRKEAMQGTEIDISEYITLDSLLTGLVSFLNEHTLLNFELRKESVWGDEMEVLGGFEASTSGHSGDVLFKLSKLEEKDDNKKVEAISAHAKDFSPKYLPHLGILIQYLPEAHDRNLTEQEVSTLLHEFGHTLMPIFVDSDLFLNNLLPNDIVELPSIFFESLLKRKELLREIALEMPDALMDEWIESRSSGLELERLAHISLAMFALELYSPDADPDQIDFDAAYEKVVERVWGDLLDLSGEKPCPITMFHHALPVGYGPYEFNYLWSMMESDELLNISEEEFSERMQLIFTKLLPGLANENYFDLKDRVLG